MVVELPSAWQVDGNLLATITTESRLALYLFCAVRAQLAIRVSPGTPRLSRDEYGAGNSQRHTDSELLEVDHTVASSWINDEQIETDGHAKDTKDSQWRLLAHEDR